MASHRGRIIGIDVARALALLGMVVAHMIDQTSGEGLDVEPWFQVVAGRSSALFAVLAGVSIALTTGASTSGAASGADITLAPGARRSLAIRAALLCALGLLLGLPDVGVAVILLYYGALFLCAIPVLRWSARSLVILAIFWGVAAPVVSTLVRPLLPRPDLIVPEPSSLLDPLGLLLELSVTGYYPVLTWATYLFAGMALGRFNLRSEAVARRMVLVGVWLAASALGISALVSRSAGVRSALVGTYDISGRVNSWAQLSHEITRGFFGTTPTGSWWWLGIWAPHSGSIVDVAHTTGCAVTVLGCVLVITGRLSRQGRRLVHIIFGAGTMTLTLYAVHIVLLGAPPALVWAQTIGFHVVVLGALGALFVAANARGPLELALSRLQQPVTHTADSVRSP